MKYWIIILLLPFISCFPKHNSSLAKPIDLKNQDSVKTYLKGDWFIVEDDLDKELIRIHTDKSNSLGTWNVLYEKAIQELKETGSEPLSSCPSFATLIFKKDSTYIKLVGLGGSNKIEINFLSKNKLILNNTEYLKKL